MNHDKVTHSFFPRRVELVLGHVNVALIVGGGGRIVRSLDASCTVVSIMLMHYKQCVNRSR